MSLAKSMNTRLLMRASAVLLGVVGAATTFLPQEILTRAGAAPVGFSVVLVQIAGALYLGFAVLNWMAQGNIIGGIYSRPVAIGKPCGHCDARRATFTLPLFLS